MTSCDIYNVTQKQRLNQPEGGWRIGEFDMDLFTKVENWKATDRIEICQTNLPGTAYVVLNGDVVEEYTQHLLDENPGEVKSSFLFKEQRTRFLWPKTSIKAPSIVIESPKPSIDVKNGTETSMAVTESLKTSTDAKDSTEKVLTIVKEEKSYNYDEFEEQRFHSSKGGLYADVIKVGQCPNGDCKDRTLSEYINSLNLPWNSSCKGGTTCSCPKCDLNKVKKQFLNQIENEKVIVHTAIKMNCGGSAHGGSHGWCLNHISSYFCTTKYVYMTNYGRYLSFEQSNSPQTQTQNAKVIEFNFWISPNHIRLLRLMTEISPEYVAYLKNMKG